METIQQGLTQDDLLWMIGQKDATLLLLTRQAQAIVAENERLKAELAALKLPQEKGSTNGTDHRQAAHEAVLAEAPGGTTTD